MKILISTTVFNADNKAPNQYISDTEDQSNCCWKCSFAIIGINKNVFSLF